MPSKLSDYEIIHMIGSGSYGKCLKVRRRSDNKVLVWKDMDYGSMTEAEKQQLVSEVNLLRELKHRYIVRYHDRIIDRSKSRLYLIMEYCAGGDLASLISKYRKERRFLDEEFIIKIFAQLGLALHACHGQRQKSGNEGKVLHRDLKPANVFLDDNCDVKLGDFGLARVLKHDTSFAKTFVGTPYYMSPEQMSKNLYNEKSDIWSLGCLIYELCALVPPFTAPNQKLLAEKIKQGQFRSIPSRYSEALQNCISSMLRLASTARPSLDEILQFPLLKDVVQKYSQPDPPNALAQMKTSDEKLVKRRISSSSDTSNEEVKSKETSADVALQARERALDERLQQLKRKEINLLRREKNVEEREKAAEEKMKSAESLIRQYTELRAKQNGLKLAGDKPGVDLNLLDHKKQVHFAADYKENCTPALDGDRYKYRALTRKSADPDYEKKLHDLPLNRRGPFTRFPTDYKTRHVLGMR